jgi:hypothetical protein
MINPEQSGLSDYSAEAPGPTLVTFVLFVVNPLLPDLTEKKSCFTTKDTKSAKVICAGEDLLQSIANSPDSATVLQIHSTQPWRPLCSLWSIPCGGGKPMDFQ